MARYQDTVGADNYAAKYERSWTRRRTGRREDAIVSAMLGTLDPTASVLNAPCGAGRFVDLMQVGKRRRVRFADFSPAMLSATARTLATAGASVEIRQLDLVRDEPADVFDVVMTIRLLHHLSDEAERGRVLDFVTSSARQAVVLTFASKGTVKGWIRSMRTRLGLRHGGENLRPEAEIRDALRARGFRVVQRRKVSALFSTQVYLLATREVPMPAAGASSASG